MIGLKQNYICRHVIDIALKKNMADYQLNAKNSGQTDVLPSTRGIQSNFLSSKNETQTKSKLCNHAVLYWLREMDIIVKINLMKIIYNIEI